MQLIDFDGRFADYLRGWIDEHEDEFENADKLEEQMPDVYHAFLDTPADWLQGVKPGEYFDGFRDADELVRLMSLYIDSHVSLPDMLMNRLVEMGGEAEESLMALLDDEGAGNEKKMLAVTLLRELGSILPMERYIAWQYEREDEDELCDNAMESLEEMGEKARDAMLEALEGASIAGKEALLGALSRYPGDDRILAGLLRLIEVRPDRLAILAACLGRLGDARALPALNLLAEDEGIRYLDYIELRSAIEALGGEAPRREFYDDSEYEALFSTRSE